MLCWYRVNRRDLPWRVPLHSPPDTLPDAYSVLVSEAMLQQTQVATVIPYFHRFLQAFPTIRRLAAADEQQVLRHWQGLGYYSRARNLLACARAIVSNHDARIPDAVETLKQLPGIGRYTAGAIASLAYGKRAAIVDGNVVRVICRLENIKSDPRQKSVIEHLWQTAEALLPVRDVADYNSALMELGATVCLPRKPRCGDCPVRKNCAALATGVVHQIPPPKQAKPSKVNRRVVLCIWRARGGAKEVMVEQRPAAGRWAGMWQFVTLDASDFALAATDAPEDDSAGAAINTANLKAAADRTAGAVTPPKHLMRLRHQLTHRRYEFDAFVARATTRADSKKSLQDSPQWVPLHRLSDYPLPRPHLLIAARLAAHLS